MNPNGLTDEQIAARPEPFVGMLYWCVDGWFFWRIECPDLMIGNVDWRAYLLPGEPGCPWPPPPEFRHEWREGDRAWVLCIEGWIECEVSMNEFAVHLPAEIGYCLRDDDDYWENVAPIDTPALWIPEG